MKTLGGVPVLAVVVCVGLGLGLYSCGTDADDGGLKPSPPVTQVNVTLPSVLTAYLVNDSDIKRTNPASPERVFLEWWQALQYDNVEAAHELLSTELAETYPRERFARETRLAAAGFSLKPLVTTSRRDGRKVVLSVNLTAVANGKAVGFQPRTFRLVQEGSAWRIADLEFVLIKAEEGREARDAARRREQDQG